MGVLGAHCRGLAEEANVEKDVDFIIGTFSKSLGSVGGFCVSNHDEFDILRIACRPYMFTASLPPAVIASTLEALNQMEKIGRASWRERVGQCVEFSVVAGS